MTHAISSAVCSTFPFQAKPPEVITKSLNLRVLDDFVLRFALTSSFSIKMWSRETSALLKSFNVTEDEVSNCAAALNGRSLTLLALLEALGPALKHEDVAHRASGVDFLVQVLAAVGEGLVNGEELAFMVTFLADRLKDRAVVFPAVLRGFHAVSVRHGQHLADEDLKRVVLALTSDLSVQSFTASDRGRAYDVFAFALRHRGHTLATPPEWAERFLLGFLSSVEGETNARNLHTIFSVWPVVIARLNPAVLAVMEDVFDALACYFPIDFRGSQEGITRPMLAAKLRECLLATPAFASQALPLFLEKLDSEVAQAKVEALVCLRSAHDAFSVPSLAAHASAVWASCKQEIMGIRETTSKKVVREAYEVLRSFTKKLSPSADHGQRWMDLIWDEMAPFLRFLESSLCETAADILSSVATAATAKQANALVQKSVAELLAVYRKEESDKVLLAEMVVKLLRAITPEESSFSLAVELVDVCKEETSHKDQARRSAWTLALASATHKDIPGAQRIAIDLFPALVANNTLNTSVSAKAALSLAVLNAEDGKALVVALCEKLCLAAGEDEQRLLAAICASNTGLRISSAKLMAERYVKERSSYLVSPLLAMATGADDVAELLANQTEFAKALLSEAQCDASHRLIIVLAAKVVDADVLAHALRTLRENMDDANSAAFVCAAATSTLEALPSAALDAVFELEPTEAVRKVQGSLLNKLSREHSAQEAYKGATRSNQHLCWIVRGLLARGDQAEKELQAFLDGLATLPREQVPREVENVLVDLPEWSNKAGHHKVLPFYRQRFFQKSAPQLIKKHGEASDDRFLAAVVAQLQHVPASAAQSQVAAALPLLAASMKESGGGGGETASALLAFFRRLDAAQATKLASDVVPLMADLAKRTEVSVDQRVAALEALETAAASSDVTPELKRRVSDSLAPLMDDGKRLVRSAAAAARNAWLIK